MRVQGVKGSYKGLQRVTMGLPWVTRGYSGLHEVTRGYRGLHEGTRGYMGLQGVIGVT